jgi:hypothetical protein
VGALVFGVKKLSCDPASSEILLWTKKEGLLSRVAHDLCLEATQFEVEGRLEEGRLELEVRVQIAGLRVRGQVERGGRVVPLKEKDQREIEDNLRGAKVLDAKAHPQLVWRGSGAPQGGRLSSQGTLTLRGKSEPIALESTFADAESGVRAEGEVRFAQSRFGIRPFSAMLGALKVKDEVRVSWQLTLTSSEADHE